MSHDIRTSLSQGASCFGKVCIKAGSDSDVANFGRLHHAVPGTGRINFVLTEWCVEIYLAMGGHECAGAVEKQRRVVDRSTR